MRTIVFGLVAALSVGGAACSKSASEKDSTEVSEAQKNVNEQRKDVASERKDVASEQKDVAKEQGDLAKQQAELATAETRLATAKTDFNTRSRDRLLVIDTKIVTLDSKTDAKTKQLAGDLRARRAAVGSKLDTISQRTTSNWDDFMKTTGEELDALAKDVDTAVM